MQVISVDVYMYYLSQFYKEESTRELERAAAEKHCFLASEKEADARVKAMTSKIAALEVKYNSEE